MTAELNFGDVVRDTGDGGIFMVLAAYTDERLEGDMKGPAHWVIDIDTAYSEAGEGGAVWQVDEMLEIIERAD